MAKFYLMALLLLTIPASIPNSAFASGGSCSQYPTSCSPPCDGSCTYYTFTNHTSSQVTDMIPWSLIPLRPRGTYCNLEGEGVINSTQVMRQIPFAIGSNNINQIPWKVELSYRRPSPQTNNGPPCPPPTTPPTTPTGSFLCTSTTPCTWREYVSRTSYSTWGKTCHYRKTGPITCTPVGPKKFQCHHYSIWTRLVGRNSPCPPP